MIGEKFGKWTVLEDMGKDERGKQIYICECSCGRKKLVQATRLKYGMSSQCFMCAKEKFKDAIHRSI